MRSGDTRKQKSDHQIRSYWVHCFAQVLFDDPYVDQNTVNLWNTFLHCSKEQGWTYNLMSGIENTRDSFGPNPSVHTHRLWEAKGLGLSHCLLVKCRRVSLWRHFARQTSMYFCWLCHRGFDLTTQHVDDLHLYTGCCHQMRVIPHLSFVSLTL